ncbi:MAG TPA: hypothetical protein VGX03_09405 [Candidatus Binatia bacterium]|nr:hypothetical protein [Candidatus Binatia bacterium]
MTPQKHSLFGLFRLDPENQCLWRGRRRVTLTPKAFAVLRYLVEHSGRLQQISLGCDPFTDPLWVPSPLAGEGQDGGMQVTGATGSPLTLSLSREGRGDLSPYGKQGHMQVRPALVSKSELLDAVWPDVSVSEGILKFCVREIRAALGDDA